MYASQECKLKLPHKRNFPLIKLILMCLNLSRSNVNKSINFEDNFFCPNSFIVSDFKATCAWKKTWTTFVCPKLALTRLRMLFMGRNCPNLVHIMLIKSQFFKLHTFFYEFTFWPIIVKQLKCWHLWAKIKLFPWRVLNSSRVEHNF